METTSRREHERVIERLCDEGRFLDAHRTGEAALGPIDHWTGEHGGPLASRITAHLGAPRRSDRIDLRLHRQHRREAWAFARYVAVVLERRGPLDALQRLERAPSLGLQGDDTSGGMIALDRERVSVAVAMRDFETAEEILARRASAMPAAWLAYDRASLLMAQDRHAEALEGLRAAMVEAPGDVRLGFLVGVALTLLDRGDEAIEHLAAVHARTQSVMLAVQYAGLLQERDRAEQARGVLDAIDSPMIEDEVARSLAGMRSQVAYKLGDRATAASEARRAGNPVLDRLAARLEQPAGERRVRLAVPFVRQHHRTCAPATLAALSRFWEQPAEHLEIADAICYDGTPDHAKRRWATERGWRAVEFTVTWDAARELLDRGVPFALTTTEAHGAHLQAVVGYDEVRGSLLIRDPTVPVLVEADAEAMFEHYRSVGPRGMAMVPAARSSLLDGVSLPDAGLHDVVHELQLALDAHRRDDATEARERLREQAPGHAITCWADVALAIYDHDQAALLRASERLLELFPGDVMAELMALRSLRVIGSRTERLERLERAVARRDDRAHPIFAEELAAELLADARQHERAGFLLRHCARAMPQRGRTVALLAELARAAGRPEEAASRMRLASCLDRADEELATRSLHLAHAAGRAADEVGRLGRRRAHLGARSTASIVTYCWALEFTGRQREALDELEAALRDHPDDAVLLRTSARWLGATGEPGRADELLARAEPRSRRVDWLETAAELARLRGDSARALATWREVLDLEPLSDSAQLAYVQLLEATGRPVDAQDFLDGLVERFPHHVGLALLRAATLRDDMTRHEKALRELTKAFPADPRGHLRLAMLLAERGKVKKARASLERGQALDARSAESMLTEAAVLSAAGDVPAACATLRRAVLLHPDDASALPRLIERVEPPTTPAEVLAFARDAIVRGSLSGVGVQVWHLLARAHTPEQLDEGSAALLASRPDLTLAWAERADVLIERGSLDEAAALLERAVERFPLEARLLCAQADVAAARQRPDDELALLEQAVRLDPEQPPPTLRLAARHTAAGRFDHARAVLERALGRSPQQPAFALELARLDQRAGDAARAAERLEQLVRQAPQVIEAWAMLERLDRPEPAERIWKLSGEIVAALPRHPDAHLIRARLALGRGDPKEALRAIDEATALTPRSTIACDLRMQALQRLDRVDEALALVEPARWSGVVPSFLDGRAADLLASTGKLPAAVTRMQDILARHPDYLWGWSKLRTWSVALGDPQGALAAARQLARLEPRSADTLAALGDALDDVGLLAEACDAMDRALQIDPLRPDAAYFLGTLALRADRTAQAESALERLRTCHALDPARVSLMEDSLDTLVAAASGQADRARAALERLAAHADVPPQILLRARKALLEEGLASEAQLALADAIVKPGSTALVARLWVATERARGRWSDEHIEQLHGQPLFEPVLLAEMNTLSDRQDASLGRLLDRHAEVIESSPTLWLASAQAAARSWSPLRALMRLRAVERQPPSVALELSVDHAHVLRALGLKRRARLIQQAACEAAPDHWTAPHHHLWLALDDALDGSTRRAREHLQVLESLRCDHFPEQLRMLTQQALVFWRLPVHERRAALTLYDTEIQQMQSSDPPLDPLQRRLLARVRREYTERLSHGVEGFASLLWTWDTRPLGMMLGILLIVLAGALLPDAPALAPWFGALAVLLLVWFFRRPLLDLV